MALQVTFRDPADAARIVDALLDEADTVERDRPLLARRYRAIANDLGDALEELGPPSAPPSHMRVG